MDIDTILSPFYNQYITFKNNPEYIRNIYLYLLKNSKLLESKSLYNNIYFYTFLDYYKPDYNNMELKNIDLLYKLLKDIQINYIYIYILYCLDETNLPENDVLTGLSKSFSHNLIQCSKTSNILTNIFSLNNLNISPPDIINDRYIVLTRYILKGSIGNENKYINLPDHDFITIAMGKRYYILQSYYHSYMLSGEHGFKELSLTEYLLLHLIMDYFKNIPANSINLDDDVVYRDWYYKIDALKQLFSIYTGINYNIHGGDEGYKENIYFNTTNYIISVDKIPILVRNIKELLCTKAKNITSRLKKLDNITFMFDYNIYNAFNLNGENLNNPNVFYKYTGLKINSNIINQEITSSTNTNISYFPIKFKLNINLVKMMCDNISTHYQCKFSKCRTARIAL